MGALLVVLGAIGLLRVALQWTGLGGPARARRRLRVVESCALGPRKRLHVVEAHGEQLLVGVSEKGMSLLRVLPAAPEDAPEEAGSRRAPAPPRPAWLRRLAPGLRLLCIAVALAGPLSLPAHAEPAAATAGPSLTLSIDGATAPQGLSSTLEALLLLTLVAVAPSLLLMATCFTRVVIVLGFLRQAIGVQHLPPNQVLIGLALFTTFFVMAPVAEQVRVDAYEPYVAHAIDGAEAVERASVPVRGYLLQFTRESDLDLFLEISGAAETIDPEALDSVPMTSLLPAFMLSELRKAFEIGFMIYLPFLVVDLVIASMLISMGMIVLPPVVISLPFKLMLFVLLDGWHLVLGSLVEGLHP